MNIIESLAKLNDLSHGVPPGHWINPSVLIGSLIVWLLSLLWALRKPRLSWIPFFIVVCASILQIGGINSLISTLIALLPFFLLGRLLNRLLDIPNNLAFSFLTGFMAMSVVATAASLLGLLKEVSWLLVSFSVIGLAWSLLTTSRLRYFVSKLRSDWNDEVIPADESLYHRLAALGAASVAAVIYGSYGGLLGVVPELGDSYWMHSQILNDISIWGGIFSRLPIQPVFNFFPLGGNAAVAIPFLVSNYVGAKSCLLLSVLAAVRSIVIIFARPIVDSRLKLAASWLAVLAALSNASVYMSIMQLYQEAALTISVAMLIVLTAKIFRNSKTISYFQILLMSILAGAGVGMKLFMLPYVLIWFIGVLIVLKPIRLFNNEIIVVPGKLLLACLGLLIGGASFYIRSLLLTGNPVFPFYNKLFRSQYFDLNNFKDLRWNQPLGFDWLFKAGFGDYGDFIEASWGFVPVLIILFALTGLLYFILNVFCLIKNYSLTPKDFSYIEWIIYPVLLILPAIAILSQMNYARYITQSIVPIYCASILFVLNLKVYASSVNHMVSVSAMTSAIVMQIPFMDSAMYTDSRSSDNWKIGLLGVPIVDKKSHVLDADHEISMVLNKDFKPSSNYPRATAFYLIGDGDALIDNTKIPIGPFPGGKLDKSKILPVHSVWYFQLMSCLHDYDDKETIALQSAKIINSFYPSYLVVENSDIKKSGFKRISSLLKLSYLYKNHSVSIFRVESRLSERSMSGITLSPSCENAYVSAKSGYRY